VGASRRQNIAWPKTSFEKELLEPEISRKGGEMGSLENLMYEIHAERSSNSDWEWGLPFAKKKKKVGKKRRRGEGRMIVFHYDIWLTYVPR